MNVYVVSHVVLHEEAMNLAVFNNAEKAARWISENYKERYPNGYVEESFKEIVGKGDYIKIEKFGVE